MLEILIGQYKNVEMSLLLRFLNKMGYFSFLNATTKEPAIRKLTISQPCSFVV